MSAVADHTDTRAPLIIGSERDTLGEFLDYLRESVIRKVTGLTREQAMQPMVGSGTSLLWLVKHLTIVELSWFGACFAGVDLPLTGEYEQTTDRDTVAAAIGTYREAIAQSNAIVAAAESLDQLAARNRSSEPTRTLRWILVHMVEETARHAGHADILREQIDGSVGR
jgi:uncharacterized damage-inducible protein DinB